MKPALYILLLLSTWACKDKISPDFNNFSLELNVEVPQEAIEAIDSLPSIAITFTNTRKGYSFTERTDSSGYLNINNIESGFYTINIAERYNRSHYSIVLNASTELFITASTTKNIALSYSLIQNDGSGFVIKEYYYSGSLTPNNKSYTSDQYVEVYNNSADTLYTDSLWFVEHESYATSQSYFKDLKEDSIVVKTIWAFPQEKSYPIAPGSGFIIARDAMNHRSDPNGNPNSPVDLGDAEFEFWSDKTAATSDVDFPADNMVDLLWVYKGTDYTLHNRGGSAIALVQAPSKAQQYINSNLITKGIATSGSKYYCKIPNHWVIDAVEAIWNDEQQVNKRFANSLDAGITYIAAGSKSGLCVRRKVDYSIGKRIVYMDTNNSTIDFLRDQIPQARIYE